MKASEGQMLGILSLVLPAEVFEYFEIIKTETVSRQVHLYLDEQNIVPDEYKGEDLLSKGFHQESVVQDFPLRDKALFLHIRRRRWQIERTGEVVSRNWNLVAKGTRYSEGFAAFLKGLLGYLPDQQ
jgi:hypothetical protein